MSIIKYGNFGWPFSLFDNSFNLGVNDDLSMKTDVKENDNEYEFSLELPGMKKEDIKLAFEDGYLVISAKREKVVEDDTSKYIRRERSYGEYTRKFYIGEIDETKISANYLDGILRILVPKDEIEKSKEKKIISIN